VQLAILAATAGVIGGLAAVERKGAFQLMLSRPLVLAPLLGLALGDAAGGLALGVPLELLFLGGVNLGGAVPENETLLAAALTSVVIPAGLCARTGADPALSALGLGVCAPLAMLGQQLDRRGEHRALGLAARARERLAAGDLDPARVQLAGLAWPLLTTGVICASVVLASPLLAAMRLHCGPRLVLALAGGWRAAQLLAVAAAIRAMRERRAAWLSALSALAVFGAALLLRAQR